MYFLLTLVVGLAGYVWWRIEIVRRAEAREESLREGYRRRIAEDPKNFSAYEALADSLHQAGRLQEARDAYLGALDVGGDGLLLDRTRYKLKQVDADIRERAQAKGRRSAPPPKEMDFCPRCGAPNPPMRRHCELCNALMPFNSFWDALRNRELQRASWEGISIILILIVLLRILYFLPGDVQGVIVISATIVIAWRFLKAFDGARN